MPHHLFRHLLAAALMVGSPLITAEPAVGTLETVAELPIRPGNVSATARALGVPRTTLHYRLKQMDEMQRWP